MISKLKGALAKKIEEFEGYKLNPKYQTEMEQNAVQVVLRELKVLDAYVDFEHEEELIKLRNFRQYVHDRLDKIGIPADPEPEQNKEHGCRIKGRLNYLENTILRLGTKIANETPQKKYIESVTSLKVHISGLEVRVWREESDYDYRTSPIAQDDLHEALIEKLTNENAGNRKAIADILFEVERVNAVEVKDKEGNGIVLYKNWP